MPSFARAAVVLAVATLSTATSFAAEGRFERTLPVGAPATVSISAGSGNITVTRGAAGTVTVRGRITDNEWYGDGAAAAIRQLEQNPPIEQQGNTVTIGKIADESIAKKLTISYEVTVPEAADLTARSGSGDVIAQGIGGDANLTSGSGSVTASDIGGALSASAGSGDLAIDRIRGNVRAKSGSGSIRATGVGGTASAETGSGDIRVEVTGTGEVSASSGSGDLSIVGARGALRAKAASGDVTVDGTPAAAWEVRSASGDIVLRLPPTAAFTLEARSNSGSIDTTVPVTVQGDLPKGTLRGQVRGGGPVVTISTASGDVTIK
jgi:DUF4097 and DUF4098 domain-containing protein YvlB